jgi:hypothetical protein
VAKSAVEEGAINPNNQRLVKKTTIPERIITSMSGYFDAKSVATSTGRTVLTFITVGVPTTRAAHPGLGTRQPHRRAKRALSMQSN